MANIYWSSLVKHGIDDHFRDPHEGRCVRTVRWQSRGACTNEKGWRLQIIKYPVIREPEVLSRGTVWILWSRLVLYWIPTPSENKRDNGKIQTIWRCMMYLLLRKMVSFIDFPWFSTSVLFGLEFFFGSVIVNWLTQPLAPASQSWRVEVASCPPLSGFQNVFFLDGVFHLFWHKTHTLFKSWSFFYSQILCVKSTGGWYFSIPND